MRYVGVADLQRIARDAEGQVQAKPADESPAQTQTDRNIGDLFRRGDYRILKIGPLEEIGATEEVDRPRAESGSRPCWWRRNRRTGRRYHVRPIGCGNRPLQHFDLCSCRHGEDLRNTEFLEAPDHPGLSHLVVQALAPIAVAKNEKPLSHSDRGHAAIEVDQGGSYLDDVEQPGDGLLGWDHGRHDQQPNDDEGAQRQPVNRRFSEFIFCIRHHRLRHHRLLRLLHPDSRRRTPPSPP